MRSRCLRKILQISFLNRVITDSVNVISESESTSDAWHLARVQYDKETDHVNELPSDSATTFELMWRPDARRRRCSELINKSIIHTNVQRVTSFRNVCGPNDFLFHSCEHSRFYYVSVARSPPSRWCQDTSTGS